MIWVIARREVVTRARTRAFQVVMALLFFSIIAAGFAARFLGGDDARDVSIGLRDQGAQLGEPLGAGTEQLQVEIVSEATVDDLTTGAIDVLFDGVNLTWDDGRDPQLDDYVRQTVQQLTFRDRASDLGLDDGDLAVLFRETDLGEVVLAGDDDGLAVRLGVATLAGIATFFLLQMWGSFMMMGVIEEKSTRVVEVLLSHVEPRTLLAGKVLGLGLLALAQMVIVLIGLAVALAVTDYTEVPSDIWSALPVVLVVFLLGFAFYAAFYGAVGSTVSRQEDATTAQLPAMVPLLVAYLITVSSAANPDNIVVTLGSFIPFTSPIVLPYRWAATDMPAWQLVLALVILGAATVGMIRMAGRIYQHSLLRTGTKIALVEAFRGGNTGSADR